MEYTIEEAHGKIWLCQRGIYPPYSVLAGQEFRQLVKPYDTVEEAIKENPDAIVDLEGQRPEVSIPNTPPDWFDEADAGERWDEDY